MNKKIYIFLLVTIISFQALGSNKLSHCKLSIPHKDNYEPATFPTSNNLLRKSGEMPLICGEKMLIRGKVVDKNCVPVSDARVYVWQVACDGKFPYKPLRNVASVHDFNTNSQATFTGAGQTTTDNKGEFHFITTYPASFHHEKPHIEFRITHPLLEEFETRFYVTKTSVEEPPIDFATPYVTEEGVLVNEVKIVLHQIHPHREF